MSTKLFTMAHDDDVSVGADYTDTSIMLSGTSIGLLLAAVAKGDVSVTPCVGCNTPGILLVSTLPVACPKCNPYSFLRTLRLLSPEPARGGDAL
jgi:hypothetical protein